VSANRAPQALGRAIGALHRLEDGILALLLGAMIVLSTLQIGLRDVFGLGMSWADPLQRAMVLWLGLLGAVAASRERRHITIDVVSRSLPGRARAAAGALTNFFTGAVSGVLAWHAGRFVAQEFEFGSVGVGVMPSWLLASVIPFAFAAIALRHLLAGAAEIWGTAAPRDAQS